MYNVGLFKIFVLFYCRYEREPEGVEPARRVRAEHVLRGLQRRTGGERLSDVGAGVAPDGRHHSLADAQGAVSLSHRSARLVGRYQLY